MMGLAMAFTGFALKTYVNVFLGIFTGILSFFLDFYVDGGYEMLIIAGMAVICLLLPAYIMKK